MNVLQQGDDGTLYFYCPGCREHHGVWLQAKPNPVTGAHWFWNGSLDKPTFHPSINVLPTGGHPRCHSYVVSGQIQFLGDCSHDKRGTTVPLPPV